METSKAEISVLVQKQKAFFATQQTKAIDFRLKQLSTKTSHTKVSTRNRRSLMERFTQI